MPEQVPEYRHGLRYPPAAGAPRRLSKSSDAAKGFVPQPKHWTIEGTLGWLNRRQEAKSGEHRVGSHVALVRVRSDPHVLNYELTDWIYRRLLPAEEVRCRNLDTISFT